MQVANVKQVPKVLVANQTISQTGIKQSEKQDHQVVAKVADASKTASLNRFLEAYGDCV